MELWCILELAGVIVAARLVVGALDFEFIIFKTLSYECRVDLGRTYWSRSVS